MSLVAIVIVLLVVGVLLALVNKYGPPHVDGGILKIINVVVIIAVILWLLSLFGVFNSVNAIKVG